MPPAVIMLAHWTARAAIAATAVVAITFHGAVLSVAEGISTPQATLGAAAIAGVVGVVNALIGARQRNEGRERSEALSRIEAKVDASANDHAETRGRLDAAIEAMRAEMHDVRVELHDVDARITAIETQISRETQ